MSKKKCKACLRRDNKKFIDEIKTTGNVTVGDSLCSIWVGGKKVAEVEVLKSDTADEIEKKFQKEIDEHVKGHYVGASTFRIQNAKT